LRTVRTFKKDEREFTLLLHFSVTRCANDDASKLNRKSFCVLVLVKALAARNDDNLLQAEAEDIYLVFKELQERDGEMRQMK
jgi:hypothetical protein